MEDLKRRYEESEIQYISRLYRDKINLGLTNKEINNIINKELKTSYGESTTRGNAKYYNMGFDEGYDKALEKNENHEENTILKHEYSGYNQIKTFKETTEINKDGSYTTEKLIGIEDESKLKDDKFLLKVHGYDSKFWTIISARNSIWNTQLKGGKVTKLYASKINVKPKENNISIDEIKEWLESFDRKHKTVKEYSNTIPNNGKLLEIPLVDVHYGKKSYKFEIGENKNTDSLKTKEDFLKVITEFKNNSMDKNIEKIIFPVGNDFLNSDTIDNTTTKGTRQDNDMRWQELYLKGLETLIEAIDILSELAPVDVFYVSGNHDKVSGYHLIVSLFAWYRNDERVHIDVNPSVRKYRQFGKCAIGFSHGDTEGKRIYDVMQIEEPKIWGDTLYREMHLGHLHHEVVNEKGGLIVRSLPSITGTDAWHTESGFVGSLAKAQAFIWDREKGLVNIMFSQIN